MIQLFNRNNLLTAVFWMFVVLVLINRVLIFFTINLHFIDSDQPAMWLGASHYAQGLFYEPRYYGQDYNTFFEGLVAVPFIKCGLPVYYAVPLSTHLLFLFPFLLSAFALFFNNKKEMSIVALGILLCFPVGFDIMSAIPRGFITGLFFCSFFIFSVLHPQRLAFILLNSFAAYVGFLANQNSIIVSAPLLFYLFLLNYNNKKFYGFALSGVLLALPFDYLLNHYYRVHPEAIIYGLNNSYSFKYLWQSLQSLDARFAHISPFVENTCVVLLLLFVAMGVLAFKQSKALFYSFLVFLAIVLFSFSSSKVGDGSTWPFYSYSRMYLGFPLFFVLFLSVCSTALSRYIVMFIVVVSGFTLYKQSTFQSSVNQHTDRKNWAFVHLLSLDKLQETLKGYKAVCEQQQLNVLIIENGVWCGEFLSNGGPAVYKDFPYTFKTIADRQHWRAKEDAKKVFESFIFISRNFEFDKVAGENNLPFNVARLDDYGLFRIDYNKLTNEDFCALVNGMND
ncbi:MAG: hypothetical protein IT236_10165 [Bacteroidia bacterium]|nr:hypothetical protein [Bacteroidia bacterium]